MIQFRIKCFNAINNQTMFFVTYVSNKDIYGIFLPTLFIQRKLIILKVVPKIVYLNRRIIEETTTHMTLQSTLLIGVFFSFHVLRVLTKTDVIS